MSSERKFMPTYEQKLSMMERGLWLRCAIADCPNPANKNVEGTYCSTKCRLIVSTQNILANRPKPYYRTKRYRKWRSAENRRMWRGEVGKRMRETLIPLMSSMDVREKVAFSRKRTAKEKQAIGSYESS